MIKKSILFGVILLFFLTPKVSYSESLEIPITITMDYDLLNFEESPPKMISGVTLVPVRPLLEKLGYSLEWHREDLTVRATKTGTSILMKMNESKAQVNDKSLSLEVPPQIINNVTYVPLRFISEISGAVVYWTPKNNNTSEHFIEILIDKNSKLYNAIITRDKQAVSKLLLEGADPNAKVHTENTMLETAVIFYKDVEIVKLLLEAGGNPNQTGDFSSGGSLLHIAASGTTPELVKLLLEYGAKKDFKDSEGNTPLQIARSQYDDPYLLQWAKDAYKEIIDILEDK
ncbi:stalk domain-containing protein [Paenibacillus elgii]|uniref:stalk domain-containing protein n=1 Tax=Paenibacillus elgii TaxID=189691 RepID=UPI002041A6D5|nr:stalk domain-containing protein [Paenibacillus elgii]MCM3268837.1 stalk domain-containing protein [Paenibacillus elgii]